MINRNIGIINISNAYIYMLSIYDLENIQTRVQHLYKYNEHFYTEFHLGQAIKDNPNISPLKRSMYHSGASTVWHLLHTNRLINEITLYPLLSTTDDVLLKNRQRK